MILKNSKPIFILLLTISLFLLAVLVGGIYVIRAKNKETSELLNLVDKATEAKTLEESIEVIRVEAADDLAVLESIALTEDTLVPLIESIEEAGRVLDLSVNIVSVGKVEDKKSDDPPIIRIVMNAKGSWAGTFSFLQAMESLPNRVMIDEMNLSRGESSWDSRFTLSLFSFH